MLRHDCFTNQVVLHNITTTTTKIDTKLDIISKNVDEIRLDNKDISKSLQSLAERVSAVESSTKSAHHRLDNIEDSMRK